VCSSTSVSSMRPAPSAPELMPTAEDLGPVDLPVLEFPDGAAPGGGLPQLLDLVDRGLIRLLDLVYLRKDRAGRAAEVDLADVEQHGQPHLVAFDGARSGLLGEEDVEDVAEMMDPGSSAALLMYENRWAEPLATALRRAGARMLDSERIPVQTVLAALDELETA